jgi:hypothetical protein
MHDGELELTWTRLGTIFWLCFWRGLVLYIVGGLVATYLLHWLFVLASGNPGPSGIGLIVWIPLSLIVLRMALRKEYRGFRVALVSTRGPACAFVNCIPELNNDEPIDASKTSDAASANRSSPAV